MAAWGWNQISAIPTGEKKKEGNNVAYGWLVTQQ